MTPLKKPSPLLFGLSRKLQITVTTKEVKEQKALGAFDLFSVRNELPHQNAASGVNQTAAPKADAEMLGGPTGC